METLKAKKKITLATLKSFAKRNSDKLFVRVESSFSGMSDMVESVKDTFKPAKLTDDTGYYKIGVSGIYTVGSSRDYFTIHEDAEFIGIEVYNSCGSSILAVKKS